MAIVNQGRWKGLRWFRIFQESRPDWASDRWGIRQKLWRMLTQREERTLRRVVVFLLEQMVNEVWGKGNEVDEEASRRKGADGPPPQRSPAMPPPSVHGGMTLAD